MEACLVSGDKLDVDLDGAASVAEVRQRIAEAQKVPVAQVRLLKGELEVSDSEPVDSLQPRVSVILDPHWLPLGKYMYNDKDVLKIWMMQSQCRASKQKLFYMDGSVDDTVTAGEVTELSNNFAFVEVAVRRDDDGTDLEFVPPEDPEEWEPFSSGPRGEHAWKRTGRMKTPGEADRMRAALGKDPRSSEEGKAAFAVQAAAKLAKIASVEQSILQVLQEKGGKCIFEDIVNMAAEKKIEKVENVLEALKNKKHVVSFGPGAVYRKEHYPEEIVLVNPAYVPNQGA